MDIVLHAGRVDFLVFAGDPETSDAHQLVLVLADFLKGAELIQVGKSQLQGLLLELEGLVHIHQPVYQDHPHLLIDVLEELFPLFFLNN